MQEEIITNPSQNRLQTSPIVSYYFHLKTITWTVDELKQLKRLNWKIQTTRETYNEWLVSIIEHEKDSIRAQSSSKKECGLSLFSLLSNCS